MSLSNHKAKKSKTINKPQRKILRRMVVEALENRQLMAVDTLLATNETTNSLQLFNSQGAVVRNIPVSGEYATDVSRFQDGMVLVADQFRGIVSVDLKTGATQQLMSGNFLSVAYDPSSKDVLGADTRTRKLMAVRANESPRALLNVDGVVTCLQVFENNYYLSIVKGGRTRIERFDPRSNTSTTVYSALGSIEAIAIHASNRTIYFADQGRELLGRVNLDGSSPVVVATDVKVPKGLVFISSDLLAISSVGRKTIETFHLPSGKRAILVANTGTIEGLATLEDPTAPGGPQIPKIVRNRRLPAESLLDGTATMNYWEDPSKSSEKPPIKGAVEHNDIYDPKAPIEWGKTVNTTIEIVGEIFSFIGQDLAKSASKFDPNKPVQAATKSPYETVYGGNKGDQLKLEHARTSSMGGKGDDQIEVNAKNATAYGNQGEDTLKFNSQSGTGFGGPGIDTYELSKATRDNVIYDSSPINKIKYPGPYSELDVRMHNNDVIISQGNNVLATIKSIDLRNQEFILGTTDHKVGLSSVLRVPNIDAVRASVAAYAKRRESMEPIVKESGYTLQLHDVHKLTGLEMSVWRRDYAAGLSGDVTTDVVPVNGQFMLSIAGTQDIRDFSVFAFAPELQAGDITKAGQNLIDEEGATFITLSGHSGGGEVALRSARDLAIANPGVQINVVMINSGGVSALSADSYNMPNLNITHLRSEADILSNPLTNLSRGVSTHLGQPLVYPPQTETIVFTYDGSGPKLTDDLFGWINHNHSAERVLEYLEKQERSSLPPDDTYFSGSSFVMPVEFSKLPGTVKQNILKATDGLLRVDTTLPAEPKLEMAFDFGANRFVEPGTLPVSAETVYSTARGYGFTASAQVQNGDEAIGDDWERDFVSGSSIPFQVDLPAGAFDVTWMTGNSEGLEYLTVLANSSTISTIYNTAPKEIKETTLRIQHSGGPLALEVRDTGGFTKKAVLNGLKIKQVNPWASLPTASVADPSLTVIVPGYVESVSVFDRIKASYEPFEKIVKTAATLLSPAAPLSAFQIVSGLATIAQSSAKLYKAWSNEPPEVPAWTITQQIASNHQNALAGLPLQRIASEAVLLTTFEAMTNEQQQKLLKHSDVIIINAQKQLNDGVKPYGKFDDKVNDASAYRKSIDRVSSQIYRAIANKGRVTGLADLDYQLDVQVIAEDFATVAAREAIDRIAKENGALASKLGYVELLALNPISVEKTDKLYVNFPETRPFHYVVHNFWEDITDVAKGFVKGPLDGEEGGNYHGVEAGVVRQFSVDDELGTIRYKNFSKNNKPVRGEVTQTSYDDSGLIAQVNSNGYLSVVDTKNEKRVFQDRVFKSKPIGLQFSPDGQNLALLSEKGVLAILNMKSLSLSRLNLPNGFDVGIRWLDNGRLVTAGSGGAIQSVRVTADGQVGALALLGRVSDSLTNFWLDTVSSTQQPRIVSVHKDRTVQVWGLDSKLQPQLFLKTPLGANRKVLDVDPSRGNLLLTDGTVVEVMQIATNQLVSRLTLSDVAKGTQITAARFSKDGKLFVTGGDDQQIRIYSLVSALEGKRSLVQNYKSVMPEVRSIELSGNGDKIFVSYNDAKGGKTLDRNIAEAVSKRISLQDKLFGEEFEKAKLLPAVVFEEYADKLRFHARRDRVDLDELYGEEAKKDGWKFALPNAVDEAFADDDPMLGDVLSNRLPPKFERSIGNTTIQNVMAIDLWQMATDPEQFPVTYSVRSGNSSIVTATVIEEKLILAPVDEGAVVITLVATDGLHSATMTFNVKADGSLDRQRFATLRTELKTLVQEQVQLQKANESVDKSLKSLRSSVEKMESDVADYQKKLDKLNADLSKATTEVQSIRTAINTATKDRDQASADLRDVQNSVASAQRDVDVATSQVARARDVEAARQREFDAAKNRFDNAKPAQRAARRSEMNAAKAALDAATADRVAKQRMLQTANTTLAQWIEKRKAANNRLEDANSRLQRFDRSLRDALAVESRAKQSLDQHLAQRAPLLSTRDQLLVRLGKEQETAMINAKTASRLLASLQSIIVKLQTLRDEKWVKNLGLDAWENDSLKPTRKSQESLNSQCKDNSELFVKLDERLRELLR